MASSNLVVNIISDFDSKGFGKAETSLQKVGKAANRAGAAITGGLAAGAVVAFSAFEKGSSANARLAKTLQNTANASDEVVKSTQAYAEELAMLTGVDDDVIKDGQAILGTFSKISDSAGESGGAFERATAAAVDLAAAGFGSVESNANGLGKALQDPIKGMSLLTKQGSLTKEEQERIGAAFKKTGDLAAAQDSILEALEGQVAGVAAETADSSAIMKESFDEAAESIGESLAPVMQDLTEYAKQASEWIQDNQDKVKAFIAVLAGLSAIWLAVRGVMIAVQAATLAYHAVMLVVQAATKIWTGVQIALNIAMMLNPIGLIVIAIVALIAIIVAVLVVTRDKWLPVLKKVWEWIKQLGATIGGWFKQQWDTIKRVIQTVASAVSGAWNDAKTKINNAFESVKAKVSNVTDAIKRFWESAKTKVTGVFDSIKTAVGKVGDKISSVWDGIKSAVGGAVDFVIGKIQDVIDWFNTLKDKASNALSNLNPFKKGKSATASAQAAASPATRTAMAVATTSYATSSAPSVAQATATARTEIDRLSRALDRLERDRNVTLRVNVVGATGRAQRLLAEGMIA